MEHIGLNWGVILQGLTVASILYHTKAVSGLCRTVALHDWRLDQLEKDKKC